MAATVVVSNSSNKNKCIGILVVVILGSLVPLPLKADVSASFVAVIQSNSRIRLGGCRHAPRRRRRSSSRSSKIVRQSLLFSLCDDDEEEVDHNSAVVADASSSPTITAVAAIVEKNNNPPSTSVPFNPQGNVNDNEDDKPRSQSNNRLAAAALQESASKFKILTCSSTSCAAQRKLCGLDEYSTFSAFFVRAQEQQQVCNTRMPFTIAVEESPCLGACKQAPCVAIEHDDYVGTVALQGMTDMEFSDRVYQHVLTEQDTNRIWNSVVNAVLVMADDNNDHDEINDNDEDPAVDDYATSSPNYV